VSIDGESYEILCSVVWFTMWLSQSDANIVHNWTLLDEYSHNMTTFLIWQHCIYGHIVTVKVTHYFNTV